MSFGMLRAALAMINSSLNFNILKLGIASFARTHARTHALSLSLSLSQSRALQLSIVVNI